MPDATDILQPCILKWVAPHSFSQYPVDLSEKAISSCPLLPCCSCSVAVARMPIVALVNRQRQVFSPLPGDAVIQQCKCKEVCDLTVA